MVAIKIVVTINALIAQLVVIITGFTEGNFAGPGAFSFAVLIKLWTVSEPKENFEYMIIVTENTMALQISGVMALIYWNFK